MIGCHAAAALAAAGHRVTALVRDPEKLVRVMAPFSAGSAVEARRGDITDPESVRRALEGCEGLLHGAGIFSHSRGDAELLDAVNVQGAENVLTAAVEARLERILFVSSAMAIFSPGLSQQRASDPVAVTRNMYSSSKARAEQCARSLQEGGAPLLIVYPSAILGPHDPTVGSAPGVMAEAMRGGRILVTEGGLAYTDVRDLAELFVVLFAAADPPRRLMSTSEFLTHPRYYEHLCELTGRELKAQRLPGRALRWMGRTNDVVQALRRGSSRVSAEAMNILTRSVPVDDAEARGLMGRDATPMRNSLRDTLSWMHEAGILEAQHVGRLASRSADDPVGILVEGPARPGEFGGPT